MTVFAIAGLGLPELAILFAVLLLFVGGAKIPDLARGLGRSARVFKEEAAGDRPVGPDVIE